MITTGTGSLRAESGEAHKDGHVPRLERKVCTTPTIYKYKAEIYFKFLLMNTLKITLASMYLL